jgi:hypothetical protein
LGGLRLGSPARERAAGVPGPADRVPYRPRRRLRAWAADAAVLGVPFVGLLTFTPFGEVPSALSDPEVGGLARLISLPFSLPGHLVFGHDAARASAGPAFAICTYLCLLAFYNALFEGSRGSTPGQRAQDLAPRSVPRRAGPFGAGGQHEVNGRIGMRRAILRALARPVDGLLFGSVGAAVALTHGGRRLGDLLAGTVLDEAPTAAARPDPATAPYLDPIEAAKRRAGEGGERAVREAFAPMVLEGCVLFFGLAHRAFGDVDLLLICPQGLFVVDAKSHRGLVTEDPETGAILRDGAPFPEDVRRSLARQADHVGACLLGPQASRKTDAPPLYALLCFTRATLGDPPPPDAYSLGELPRLVRAAPRRLSADSVEILARRAEAAYGQGRYAP